MLAGKAVGAGGDKPSKLAGNQLDRCVVGQPR
jgi:hypothetical protein